MMNFCLQLATIRGNVNNKLYPRTAIISSLDELKAAAQFDHVAGSFKNNTRNNDNFISCDVVILDVDNDETEDSAGWVMPERIAEIFKDVEFYAIYSKSHNKPKVSGGKEYSARPRYHVYFALSQTIDSAERVRTLKESLIKRCPAFDPNAKDAARFIFGVEEPDGLYFAGTRSVDEFIKNTDGKETINVTRTTDNDILNFRKILDLSGRAFLNAISNCEVIPAGYRDDTLLKVANTALMAHEEGAASDIFLDATKKCEPRLEMKQTTKIWDQARKFTQREKARQAKAQAKAERAAEREETQKKLLTNGIVENFLVQNGISLRLNVISGRAEVTGLPEQSELLQRSFRKLSGEQKRDKSIAILALYLNDVFKLDNYQVNYKILRERLSTIASTNEYNPVEKMLESVKWDKQDRIESLAEILNITLDRQAVTLLKKWLVQAVAMALNTGRTALEFCLTLKGPQGCGKTSFFRKISLSQVRQEFFKEGALLDVRDKDKLIQATSAWLCELGELDATLSREQSNLKAFLTNTHDDYRRPYSDTYEHAPRRTCFCGTVNSDAFLRDLTGNRRWAVIEITAIDKQTLSELSIEWLIQMWRQAYEIYLADNNYFRLTDDELAALEEVNKQSLVLLPGETELYDLLNWDAPINAWSYTTSTELLRSLDIKSIDARKLGYAIKAISRRDNRIKKMRNSHGYLYLLPPTKNTFYK